MAPGVKKEVNNIKEMQHLIRYPPGVSKKDRDPKDVYHMISR